jgi:hypothetical protein
LKKPIEAAPLVSLDHPSQGILPLTTARPFSLESNNERMD